MIQTTIARLLREGVNNASSERIVAEFARMGWDAAMAMIESERSKGDE